MKQLYVQVCINGKLINRVLVDNDSIQYHSIINSEKAIEIIGGPNPQRGINHQLHRKGHKVIRSASC